MNEFTTRDPERAHEFLRAAYVDHTMRITGSTEAFRMAHTRSAAGPFSSSTLAHTMSVEHVVPPLGFVLVARVLAGQVERELQGETLRATRGDVFLIAPPDSPYTIRWDRVWLQLVRLDTRVLAEVAGVEPRFTGYRPTSPTTARYCAAVLDFVASDVLADNEVTASPILVRNTAHTLGTAVLETFANTAVATPPGDHSAATLRRATEFVEANAHRPIGPADIAVAARVSPAGLDLAFRLRLGITPAGHLRQVRLDRAHRELLTQAPGDTVAAVATRWGFPSERAFTAAHRARYGPAPES